MDAKKVLMVAAAVLAAHFVYQQFGLGRLLPAA